MSIHLDEKKIYGKRGRQERALSRFYIDEERAHVDAVYRRRKEIELESLKKKLGR